MDDVYLKQLRPQISKLLPGRTEQKLQLLNSQCRLSGKGTVKKCDKSKYNCYYNAKAFKALCITVREWKISFVSVGEWLYRTFIWKTLKWKTIRCLLILQWLDESCILTRESEKANQLLSNAAYWQALPNMVNESSKELHRTMTDS